ncbi:transcription initiation factor TFIID subunit 4-like [Stigmatopora nigra]
MAGASDPLEDMLFNQVDEKAVSDLVGSLESQLGEPESSAAASGPPSAAAVAAGSGSPSAAPAAATTTAAAAATTHFSGKVREQEPQQGHSGAALKLQPPATPVLPSSTSGGGASGSLPFGPAPPSSRLGAPGAPTSSGQPAEASGRTASPGSQSFNGAAKLLNSAGSTALMAAAPPANLQSAVPGDGRPAVPAAQNGLEPKAGVPSPSPGKVLAPGNSVVLAAGTPPPSAVKAAVNGPAQVTVVPGPVTVGQGPVTVGQGPVTVGQGPVAVGQGPVTVGQGPVTVGQGPVTVGPGPVSVGAGQVTVRPAGPVQPPRPAPVVGPRPPLTLRPQQQATIQLPPGFTMPAGMVLVRIETGQLVMVPQHVLAQAQAKTQQSPAVPQRPTATTAAATAVRMGPAAATAVRVGPAAPAPRGSPGSIRLAAPPQTGTLQSPGASSTPLQNPVSGQAGAVPGKTAEAVKGGRVTVVSQEMQENVKKCKNFLSTLIKLASNNSPSPDTSKNVKTLVQDLLDAKIEPEEFTSRLQAELKSSPQPYLIPFLKKSLPALRQSFISSQQSLVTPPAVAAAATATAFRPRLPVASPGVRMNAPLANAAVVRGGVQTLRPPLVVGARTPGATVRGPLVAGRSAVALAVPSNQKKPGDPGGGTFRDDDDINDVASMAGVNLSEENARILATGSELVGTKIRSCKDEAFLPAGLLQRRIVDIARRLGVSEVPPEVLNLVSHATQLRLRSLLEKVSALAQHRSDGHRDKERQEPSDDVRAQLRFFEQLERLEKQRKDEREREILLKAAKSRARQEDPEQARLKQKAKEMQQQELAVMRQRDANLTALAAIGPRKKRKVDSPGAAPACAAPACAEVSSGAAAASSARQPWRQRVIRVNLRDLIVCLEQDGSTARSLMLYKALLK